MGSACPRACVCAVGTTLALTAQCRVRGGCVRAPLSTNFGPLKSAGNILGSVWVDSCFPDCRAPTFARFARSFSLGKLWRTGCTGSIRSSPPSPSRDTAIWGTVTGFLS
eukprot:Rmarinus@m.1945